MVREEEAEGEREREMLTEEEAEGEMTIKVRALLDFRWAIS